MAGQIDIEELVQRCRSANARAYIKEAVDCYRIGAYRACVITTWIALVYDIVDKLRELAFTGDAGAIKRVVEFDLIQKNRDTEAALKFEKEILNISRTEFELITVQEATDLGRLLDDRNRCGHPNLNRDNKVYSPPAELARFHLRMVVEHVLEREPVQGKAALSSLQQSVDSDYFPTTEVDAETVLKATPLRRAKPMVVRDFILGALISIMRETLSEKKILQRWAATKATRRLQPDVVREALQERFDDAVFRTPDSRFFSALWLLVSDPDLQSFVKEATWVKFENYVTTPASSENDSVLLALAIPRLRNSAVGRVGNLSRAELIDIVGRIKGQPDPIFIDRCITVYGEAGSFDAANTMAKVLIQPLIPYLSPDQIVAIVQKGANYEVKESNQFPGLVLSLKNTNAVSLEVLKEAVVSSGLHERLGPIVGIPPAPQV